MSCKECTWNGTPECPYWTEADEETCDEFLQVIGVVGGKK